MQQHSIFLYLATIAPEYYGSGFPPLRNHNVVAAALCHLSLADAEYPIKDLAVFAVDGLDEEQKLLEEVSGTLSMWGGGASTKTALTTFYGRTFAIPILFYRCLHYGVPLFLPPERVELADELMLHNPDIGSLRVTDAATLIGLPERYSIDVAARFHEKDFGTIKSGVALDLLISVLVFLRMQHIGAPEFASATSHMSTSDWRSLTRRTMDAFYELYKHSPPTYGVLRDYLKSIDLKKVLLANQR